MFPSCRNQSIDSQSKSTDWFLYDGNIGRYKVNLLEFSGVFSGYRHGKIGLKLVKIIFNPITLGVHKMVKHMLKI